MVCKSKLFLFIAISFILCITSACSKEDHFIVGSYSAIYGRNDRITFHDDGTGVFESIYSFYESGKPNTYTDEFTWIEQEGYIKTTDYRFPLARQHGKYIYDLTSVLDGNIPSKKLFDITLQLSSTMSFSFSSDGTVIQSLEGETDRSGTYHRDGDLLTIEYDDGITAQYLIVGSSVFARCFILNE